jgi:hypothetical protein
MSTTIALRDLLRHGFGELRGRKGHPQMAELQMKPDAGETPEAFVARLEAAMSESDEYSIVARNRQIQYAVIYHPVLPAA